MVLATLEFPGERVVAPTISEALASAQASLHSGRGHSHHSSHGHQKHDRHSLFRHGHHGHQHNSSRHLGNTSSASAPEPRKRPQVSWVLNPFSEAGGGRGANQTCLVGRPVANRDECFEAAQAAASKEGLSVRGLKDVHDAKLPHGCSYSHITSGAVFNRHPQGRSKSELHRSICAVPYCEKSLCDGTGECQGKCVTLNNTLHLVSAPGKSMPFHYSAASPYPFAGTEPRPSARIGVIVMHGAQRDGHDYLCRMMNAVLRNKQAGGLWTGSLEAAASRVVVVAPQVNLSWAHRSVALRNAYLLSWARTSLVDDTEQETLLSWAAGANSSDVISASLFDVLDDFVIAMANRKLYPNMHSIMVVGHSKGGSVVQRYALTTRVNSRLPPGFDISFHAANPAAYVYLSPERPIRGRQDCEYSNNATIAQTSYSFKLPSAACSSPGYCAEEEALAPGFCAEADHWPYGLGGRFPDYVTRMWGGDMKGLEAMRTAYLRKRVTIYSGSSDTCNDVLHERLSCEPLGCRLFDHKLEATCAAMRQGPNRMARAHAYAQQSRIATADTHKLVVVPYVGHSSCLMFQSPEMRQALFGEEADSGADQMAHARDTDDVRNDKPGKRRRPPAKSGAAQRTLDAQEERRRSRKENADHESLCAEGIFPNTSAAQGGDVCCPAACGEDCAGAHCGQAPGGHAKCCASFIKASGRVCSSSKETACIMPDRPTSRKQQANQDSSSDRRPVAFDDQ